MPQWDPQRYLTFADERQRPFLDLLARVGADPAAVLRIVDLGCGPGNLTGVIQQRWPHAEVVGVDSSPQMIDSARERQDGADYVLADLRTWTTDRPVDVMVSNAALQWVPGHLELLPQLAAAVRPGGWFAFQVPGNFDEPSHVLRQQLAAEAPYADHVGSLELPSSHDPEQYWQVLADLGWRVDAWQTTYLHQLQGPDPVFTWISGTSARPVLQALPEALREPYIAELKRRLAQVYPPTEHGVLLPFRRVFVVAQRPE